MNSSQRAPEFVELFALSARRVYSYIRTLIPQQSDADDVFQETSKVLWEKFSEYDPGTDFCSWALSIAHFKALQARRRVGTSRMLLGEKIESLLENAAVESIDLADSRFRALAECFECLPEADRELIDARYRQGANTKAIATERNRSTDSVYRSLRRIHQALFECVRKKLHEEAGS